MDVPVAGRRGGLIQVHLHQLQEERADGECEEIEKGESEMERDRDSSFAIGGTQLWSSMKRWECLLRHMGLCTLRPGACEAQQLASCVPIVPAYVPRVEMYPGRSRKSTISAHGRNAEP